MEARRRYYDESEYIVEGTAARQLQVVPEYEREQERTLRPVIEERPRHAPKVSHGIDFVSMILLVATMAITLYMCYNYLQVQGNIVQLERDIAVLEQELEVVLAENAAAEEGLNNLVNWDEVYRVAVSELGMVYPNKNEVITYRATENGHVIQYKDIPE